MERTNLSTDNAIYVLGGGGHGRVVLDALLASGMQVKGVLDPVLKPGETIFNVPILGDDEYLNNVDSTGSLLVSGLGANPRTQGRKNLFEGMKKRGFAFAEVHHRSAVIGRECHFGEGSQIMAGAVLQNRVLLGDNSVINTGASLDHDCVISAHAFVAPRAVLCGSVTVAECAFIGAGSILHPGVQIGANAVVGAGSVVRKSVPQGWMVAGNPIKKIGVNVF